MVLQRKHDCVTTRHPVSHSIAIVVILDDTGDYCNGFLDQKLFVDEYLHYPSNLIHHRPIRPLVIPPNHLLLIHNRKFAAVQQRLLPALDRPRRA